MSETQEIQSIIKEYEDKGKVIIMTPLGLVSYKLDDLIDQPISGLLYDLNRSEEVILTHLENNNQKWVNDYAVTKVIRGLKEQVTTLEEQIRILEEQIKQYEL